MENLLQRSWRVTIEKEQKAADSVKMKSRKLRCAKKMKE